MKMILDRKVAENKHNGVLDYLLRSGYGIFETVKILNGETIFLKEHYERMAKSALYFNINVGTNLCEIVEMAKSIIKINETREGALKILMFRSSDKDHLSVITDNRKYENEKYLHGVSLKFSNIIKDETSLFIKHKTINCLENILERENALKEGYEDAVFINAKGHITETSVANIFFINKNIIYTPSCASGILPGIIRGKIINIAKEKGMFLKEGFFKKEHLMDSESVFITNSLMGIMPVRNVCGKFFCTDNSIVKDICELYKLMIK